MIAFKLFLLVVVANAAPLLGRSLLGHFLAYPLDFGLHAADGRSLLGSHSTIRGVFLAVLACSVAAMLLAIPVMDGMIIALAAMAGDILSSFSKRRMGLQPGAMALGLDQIPESLFPLLIVAGTYGLSLVEVLALSLLFMVFELLASRLLFHLGIRNHPY